MDHDLINNIIELSDETLKCLKLLEKEFQLFMFDEEADKELGQFITMMRRKAIRIASPRNINDINDNIKKKAMKYEWDKSQYDD